MEQAVLSGRYHSVSYRHRTPFRTASVPNRTGRPRESITTFLTDTGHLVRYPSRMEQAVLSGRHFSVSYGFGTLPYGIHPQQNKLSPGKASRCFLLTQTRPPLFFALQEENSPFARPFSARFRLFRTKKRASERLFFKNYCLGPSLEAIRCASGVIRT